MPALPRRLAGHVSRSDAGVTGAVAQRSSAPVLEPGYLGGGVTLLPNGWRIAPAGRHISIGDLPLNMVLSPDGDSLIVSNNGYAEADAARRRPRPRGSRVDVRAGRRVAGTGVASGRHAALFVRRGVEQRPRVAWKQQPAGARPRRSSSRRRPDGRRRGRTGPSPTPQSFVGGIAVTPDGARLCAVHVLGKLVNLVDARDGARSSATVELPAEPYTCLLSRDGATLFVSLWGGAKVLVFDAATLAPKGEIAGRRASERDGAVRRRQAAVRRVREHERGLGGRRRVA